MDDKPRFLHRSSTHGYTTSEQLALHAEPEAVDETTQDRITRAAADRQLRAWMATRQHLLTEVEYARAHISLPHLDRAMRAITREIAALDRRLR